MKWLFGPKAGPDSRCAAEDVTWRRVQQRKRHPHRSGIICFHVLARRGAGGDYFGMQLGWTQGRTVWFVGEYARGGTDWGTWVAEMALPKP
jgi:hypothetical protein